MSFFRSIPVWTVDLFGPVTIAGAVSVTQDPSSIPWQVNPGPTSPQILNVVLPLAATEYQIDLPAGTRRYLIQARGRSTLHLAISTGQSATLYVTVANGSVYTEESVLLPAGLSLFVQANHSDVLEILYWT